MATRTHTPRHGGEPSTWGEVGRWGIFGIPWKGHTQEWPSPANPPITLEFGGRCRLAGMAHSLPRAPFACAGVEWSGVEQRVPPSVDGLRGRRFPSGRTGVSAAHRVRRTGRHGTRDPVMESIAQSVRSSHVLGNMRRATEWHPPRHPIAPSTSTARTSPLRSNSSNGSVGAGREGERYSCLPRANLSTLAMHVLGIQKAADDAGKRADANARAAQSAHEGRRGGAGGGEGIPLCPFLPPPPVTDAGRSDSGTRAHDAAPAPLYRDRPQGILQVPSSLLELQAQLQELGSQAMPAPRPRHARATSQKMAYSPHHACAVPAPRPCQCPVTPGRNGSGRGPDAGRTIEFEETNADRTWIGRGRGRFPLEAQLRETQGGVPNSSVPHPLRDRRARRRTAAFRKASKSDTTRKTLRCCVAAPPPCLTHGSGKSESGRGPDAGRTIEFKGTGADHKHGPGAGSVVVIVRLLAVGKKQQAGRCNGRIGRRQRICRCITEQTAVTAPPKQGETAADASRTRPRRERETANMEHAMADAAARAEELIVEYGGPLHSPFRVGSAPWPRGVVLGEMAEDASGTRPFLQILSRGTPPGRVRDASAAVSPCSDRAAPRSHGRAGERAPARARGAGSCAPATHSPKQPFRQPDAEAGESTPRPCVSLKRLPSFAFDMLGTVLPPTVSTSGWRNGQNRALAPRRGENVRKYPLPLPPPHCAAPARRAEPRGLPGQCRVSLKLL
eukprot:gene18383-biopygen2410